jgi:predicted Zn-dependent peptidase
MFRSTTLDNGLQIIAELNPAGYTASFGYFVKTGARDETDEVAGVSHFLEHMVFKGTPTRSAADVNRQLDELGGQSNAYTSEEQTVYYASVIPKYQDRIVELLTDIMRPTLRTEDFETERMVILEEIAKYDDQPPFGAFERSMESYFGSHGLGRRILGTVDTVSAMTPEQMRAYFEANYGPESIVLAAAGNVDFDALVQSADRLTRSWTHTPPRPARTAPVLVSANGSPLNASKIAVPDAMQTYTIRVGSAPCAKSMDRYPMRLLTTVLGDESGSRLFWELIDTGRAEMAVAWTQEFDDCGVTFLYVVGHPDDAESNLRLVDEAVARIQSEGVTEEELTQAINKTTAGLVLQSERPSSRMFSIGNNWITRGVYDPLDDLLARYRTVTPDKVRDVMNQYPLDPRVEVQTHP